jgi:hypothetical protein
LGWSVDFGKTTMTNFSLSDVVLLYQLRFPRHVVLQILLYRLSIERKTTQEFGFTFHEETPLKDGVAHGMEVGFYGGGTRRRWYETQWNNGKRHGIDRGWRGNGEKSWEFQYENGVLKSHILYPPL